MVAVEGGWLREVAGPGSRLAGLWRTSPGGWAVAIILLLLPAMVSDFVLFQIFGWGLILGMISLSLMFLAGYGGMVSMLQMTVAGCAGYMLAIFGDSTITANSLGLAWYVTLPLAIGIAVVFATLAGLLSVRTEGIYMIVITLAIASAFFFFVRQNYVIFNGFTGFNGVLPPELFGVDWRRPIPFYYLALGCAAISLAAVTYVARAPFGLALQGIRDNPRRMAALGFNVTAHRVAAYTFASVIAAVAGILLVWQNSRISPDTIGVGRIIDILIIAVIGGLRRPIGPFVGAIIYVLLSTYALDILTWLGLPSERYRLLIGLGFLVIVLWSPDGILGLADRWRNRRRRDALTDGAEEDR